MWELPQRIGGKSLNSGSRYFNRQEVVQTHPGGLPGSKARKRTRKQGLAQVLNVKAASGEDERESIPGAGAQGAQPGPGKAAPHTSNAGVRTRTGTGFSSHCLGNRVSHFLHIASHPAAGCTDLLHERKRAGSLGQALHDMSCTGACQGHGESHVWPR